MSSEFDWQTEEEDGWEEDSLAKTPEKQRIFAFNRRLVLILVLMVVLVLAGFLLYADRRANERTKRLQADVLDTHQVLLQAVVDRDLDRFKTLISADPLSWNSLQVELLRNDLMLSRKPLGFGGPSGNGVDQSISESQVFLSRRLDSAEVTSSFPYEYKQSDSITQTVYLERSFAYRLDGNSWMLSDLDESGDYWGQWHRISGEYSTVIVPERDAEIGARLASEFDTVLNILCLEPEVSCPDNFHLNVRLDNTENSLLRLHEGIFNNRILVGYGPETIELPTPSLVGLPLDETGFQALKQAYRSWLAAILLTNFPEEGEQVDAEILDTKLVTLGFSPIPALVRALPFRTRIPFPADLTPPEQDIMMLCSDSKSMLLLRYNIVGGEWELGSSRALDATDIEFSGYPPGMLTRLIDYNGAVYILREPGEESSVWRLYLWQAGTEELITELDEPVIFWPPIVQPGTNSLPKLLVVYQVHFSNNSNSAEYWSLDLEKCAKGECQFELLDTIPTWSPDGEYSLVIKPLSNGQLEIYRGNDDDEVMTFLGYGHSLTWISDESYAYVSDGFSGDVPGISELNEDALIKTRIDIVSDKPMDVVEWTLASEQLRMAIPEAERPAELAIKRASTGEVYEGEWYILGTNTNDSPNGTAYLFRYDESSSDIELVETYFGQVFGYSSSSGIDSDHFGFVVFDGRSLRYIVYDSQEDIVRQISDLLPYDQSADGDWLLFNDGNSLVITSLFDDFEWTVEHGLDSCNAAVWINRE